MNVLIKAATIEMAVRVSRMIEEFDNPDDASEYEKRLRNVPHCIFTAFVKEEVVGFKVGYEREGYFYSWMGGVRCEWRRKGVAKALADRQEEWARQQGYTSVTFKTRNRLKPMMIFALRNGFNVVGVQEREDIRENRIIMRKEL
jgi:predicted GNAT superfamily acetyltransferase